jgi:hypothetical protein
MIITLCGATKFKREIIEWAKRLTLEGHIVLMPWVFGHCGDGWRLTDDVKPMLDKLHHDKIRMSNEVHVICPDGYIGESTKNEILVAESHGIKVIKRTFPYCFGGYEPEDKSWCPFCKHSDDCYNTAMAEEHGYPHG